MYICIENWIVKVCPRKKQFFFDTLSSFMIVFQHFHFTQIPFEGEYSLSVEISMLIVHCNKMLSQAFHFECLAKCIFDVFD